MAQRKFNLGGKSEKKKPEQWIAGSEVRTLAESIIAEHHPHLATASILYVMRYPSWKSKGNPVGGCARLATPFDRAALDDKALAFVITLNAEEWERLPLPTQTALLDHELCHCEYDFNKESDDDPLAAYCIVGHDVEEFGDVIERHGLWTNDLQQFADEVGRQLELQLGRRERAEQRPAEAAKRGGRRGAVEKARDRLIDAGTRDGGTMTIGVVGGEQKTFTAEDGDAARERLAMEPPVGGVQ